MAKFVGFQLYFSLLLKNISIGLFDLFNRFLLVHCHFFLLFVGSLVHVPLVSSWRMQRGRP
jgi:hypothetical protein